jgi:membrane protease YdiL (CAAX protease family)
MTRLWRNEVGSWRTGWRIVALLALLAVAVIAINIGWRTAGLPGQRAGGAWWFLLLAALVSGSALGLIVLLLRVFENTGPAAVGLPFQIGAWKAAAAGTVLGAIPICLLAGLSLVGGYGSFLAANVVFPELVIALLPVLITGFLLAGWEELVLRGYLLRQLSLGLNPAAGVLITGIVFGLVHSGNPGANWQGLLYTAIGGILMGWLMVRSGSLWLLIGYHFGWNATASSVFGLELSGLSNEGSLFVGTLSGSDWLTGGSYGFEASLPAVVFEVLVLSVTLRLIGTSRRSPADAIQCLKLGV